MAETTQTRGRTMMRRWWVLGVTLLGCDSGPKVGATAAPERVQEAPPPAPPPKPPPPPSVNDAATWQEAFAIAKTGDSTNVLDPGSAVFAVWASRRLRWADVSVAQDETSFAKVLKDSVAERGRRMCVSGSIVQIEVDRSTEQVIYSGLVATAGSNIVQFAAIGSSGELVKGSPARYCGVVAGRHSYSNAGGGTTHGIQMVGMFDLPENRARQPVEAMPKPKANGTGTVIDINAL